MERKELGAWVEQQDTGEWFAEMWCFASANMIYHSGPHDTLKEACRDLVRQIREDGFEGQVEMDF